MGLRHPSCGIEGDHKTDSHRVTWAARSSASRGTIRTLPRKTHRLDWTTIKSSFASTDVQRVRILYIWWLAVLPRTADSVEKLLSLLHGGLEGVNSARGVLSN